MAELTIHLRLVPDGTEFLVELTEDEDALPHEHETRHQEWVHRLFGGTGLRRRLAAEQLTMERVRPAVEPVPG